MKVVIDTNILVSALKSKHGASNEIMRMLALGKFDAYITTTLLLEYEDVLSRPKMIPNFSMEEINDYLNSLCAIALYTQVYFRWRPYLPDPKDDMVLECALASGADYIITHNIKDFPDISSLGIYVMTPSDFLCILRS